MILQQSRIQKLITYFPFRPASNENRLAKARHVFQLTKFIFLTVASICTVHCVQVLLHILFFFLPFCPQPLVSCSHSCLLAVVSEPLILTGSVWVTESWELPFEDMKERDLREDQVWTIIESGLFIVEVPWYNNKLSHVSYAAAVSLVCAYLCLHNAAIKHEVLHHMWTLFLRSPSL